MGGNATKHLGTERIDKETYLQVLNILKHELMENELYVEEESFHFTKPFSEKTSFGDLDLLSYIPKEDFLKIIENNEKFKLIHDNDKKYHSSSNASSFAISFLLDGEYTVPFQVDYILINKQSFNFACNYFDYNDLGNFIGKIVSSYGYKFGFDGLSKKVYFDKHTNVIDVKFLKSQTENGVNEASAGYEEFNVTCDFFETLKIFGFDVNVYKNGFDNLNQIYDFVVNSKYFDKLFFDLDERGNKDRVRDRKRPNYNLLLEYIEKNCNKNENYPYNKFKTEIKNEVQSKFPDFVQKRTELIKERRRKYTFNKRFNYHFLLKTLNKKFNIDLYTPTIIQDEKSEFKFIDKKVFINLLNSLKSNDNIYKSTLSDNNEKLKDVVLKELNLLKDFQDILKDLNLLQTKQTKKPKI